MVRMLLLVMLVLLPMDGAPLVAASPPQNAPAVVSVNPSQMTLAPGTSGTVSIVASVSGGDLGSWTLNVAYDPAVIKASGCIAGAGSVCNKDFRTDAVGIAGASTAVLPVPLTLATITFLTIGGAGAASVLRPVILEMTDRAVPAQPLPAIGTDGAVTITVAGALPGDIVADCAVDIQDFSVLLTTFGKTPGQNGYDGRADLNGSGTIDIVDFSILLKNFGTRC